MNRAHRILRTSLYIVIVILINLIVAERFARLDLTEGRVFSLSELSRDTVATLNEPLTVRAFFSRNIPAPYNNMEQAVRDLLEEYDLAANEYFSYSVTSVEPVEEEQETEQIEIRDEARTFGLYPVEIQAVEGDEIRLVSAYMGIAFVHGDLVEVIPAVTSAEDLELQITGIIQEMGRRVGSLVALEQNLQVKLFLSSSLSKLDPAYGELPATVERIVADLKRRYYGKVDFQYLDSTVDTSVESEAAALNISPFTMRLTPDDPGESVYAAVVVTNGKRIHGGSLLIRGNYGYSPADSAQIRNTLDEGIKAMLGVQERIGYVADFETPPYRGKVEQGQVVEADLSRFYQILSDDYEFKGLLLETDVIPDSLSALLVVSPQERLSDWALFQIDQYLLRGGTVVVFQDPYIVATPTGPDGRPHGEIYYSTRMNRLDELLEHYGVRVPTAYVLDEVCYVQQQQSQTGGMIEQPLYQAPLIHETSFSDEFPFLEGIDEMIVLNTAPLEIVGSMPEGRRADVLFSSSDDAWEFSDDPNRVNPIYALPPVRGERAELPLAYLLEGRFDSYFTDRAVPLPPTIPPPDDGQAAGPGPSLFEGDTPVFVESGNGRLLVFGTSMLLSANILGPEGRTPNSLFLENLFDFIHGRGDLAALRSKGGRIATLPQVEPGRRLLTKIVNIGVVPALVVCIGLVVLLFRNRRKRRIHDHFTGRRR